MARGETTGTVNAHCDRCGQSWSVKVQARVRLLPPVPMNPKFAADAVVEVGPVNGGDAHHECMGTGA